MSEPFKVHGHCFEPTGRNRWVCHLDGGDIVVEQYVSRRHVAQYTVAWWKLGQDIVRLMVSKGRPLMRKTAIAAAQHGLRTWAEQKRLRT